MIVPGFNHKVFPLSFGVQNCKKKKPNIVIASQSERLNIQEAAVAEIRRDPSDSVQI